MEQADLMLVHQDLSGIVRGRTVPARRAAEALRDGLPWVPANLAISALGTIPADNPFGPMGEVRLVPDADARVRLPGFGPHPPLDLVLCDLRAADGGPWPCCPRSALRAAVGDLAAIGLTLRVAFEHEFSVRGLGPPHVAFSPTSTRAASALAAAVLGTLDHAGIPLDQFVAEYASDQFEVAAAPADPVVAADRAVLTRETVRDRARALGLRATFLPKPRPDQAGNGTHLHLSLWRDGRPATLAADGLTPEAGAFAAGVLAHAASVVAFTTTSPNGYLRVRPQSWVGAYACLGTRNREAALRLVPRGAAADGSRPGATLEFRVADGTANPYLALAAVVRAGLDGVRARLPAPADVTMDPHQLSPADRESLGIVPLPASLEAAIEAVRASGDGSRWFGPELTEAYLCCRRADAAAAATIPADELASRLAEVY